MITKSCVMKLYNEGDISQSQMTTFYASVRAFYVRAFEYALANLPLQDDLLKNATFVNFNSRENSTFTHVEYFVQRYLFMHV